jgi:hypothetical protein
MGEDISTVSLEETSSGVTTLPAKIAADDARCSRKGSPPPHVHADTGDGSTTINTIAISKASKPRVTLVFASLKAGIKTDSFIVMQQWGRKTGMPVRGGMHHLTWCEARQ